MYNRDQMANVYYMLETGRLPPPNNEPVLAAHLKVRVLCV
jgi:hypothetical protein